MSTPQQPELRRSGRGATDEHNAKARAKEEAAQADEPKGWVPPDNRPGHRPEHQQDKPDLDEG